MTLSRVANLKIAPYTFAEFHQTMARLGPLGPRPRIACAVSGGSDSLALLLLLDHWCRGQGGEVLALSVDHGLRPEAKDEQEGVAALCREKGIPFVPLFWAGDKPHGAIQAAARQARYGLLEQQCQRQGLLYLALAHHEADQAETFLLRLDAGSGISGLAGMARWRARQNLCYLRPLLDVSKVRLQAFLGEQAVTWVEDPSNHDMRYKRVVWRQAAAPLNDVGLSPEKLTQMTAIFGRMRHQWDLQLTRFLAVSVDLRPEGFAWVTSEDFLSAPRPLAEAALTRLITCLSGSAYPPRQTSVKRLLAQWCDNGSPKRGYTLGGCRLLPRRGGRWLVIREEALAEKTKILAGEKCYWDGRFAFSLSKESWADFSKNDGFSISCLGSAGWRQLLDLSPELRSGPIPQAAAVTLPALRHLDSLLVVPHLEYRQGQKLLEGWSCRFRPRQLLADPAFT